MRDEQKTKRELVKELMELRSQITEWQETFDVIPDIVALISPSFEIIKLNKAGYRSLGKKPGEVIGKKCYEVMHGLDTPIDGCPCREAMATKKAGVGEITQGGKYYIVTASPILDENNEVIALTHTFKDITERKKAEEELRESEERFRELAELLPQIVFEIDERGNFTFANRWALEVSGYTQEDIDRGLNVLQVFIAEDRDRVKKNIQRILSRERLDGNEYTVLRKDGSTFPVIIYSSPIIHEKKPVGLRGIGIDITERRRAEKALQKWTHDLGERVKELNCLYGISDLVQKEGVSLEKILEGTVNLIPPSWQYPEITCARITLEDQGFKTDNFRETAWKQTSDIRVHGRRVGTLEVCYLEERPESEEGPFLKEERNLINAIAKRLGRIVEYKQAEETIERRLEFQKTVSKISSHFVTALNLDDAINKSLKDMGVLIPASRSYLFILKKDATFMDNTHEWCAEGVTPQIDNLKDLPVDRFPWWMEKLSGGEIICIEDVSKLPPEAKAEKEILESQDIRSLLVFPLNVEGKLAGFIGFDNIMATGKCRDEDVALLGIFSEVLGSALERVQVQEEINRTARDLAQLIDTANAPIFGIDAKGLLNEWNQKATEITGYSKKEVLGRNLVEEFITEDYRTSVKEVLDKALKGEEVANFEFPLYSKKGEQVLVLLNSTTRRDTSGNVVGVVGIGQDITELKVETEKAKEADRLKSEFLASVSHEIRTPLSTIKGAAYLLNKSSLSEEQRRFCSMIRDSGEHLLRIINDILDLARIEAGQARLEEKELSLKELVEKTVFGFELRAKRKGLELNTIYPSDLPLEIRADEGKLSQVLTNLVDNALKFTQQGKVEVKLEKLADLNIRLQVKDTGIGISEEKLSRIFEKFYQVDGTSRRKYEGTGLGLTIVRELAKLMAGKIEARSRLGKGSTFSFTFPYSAAKQRMVQAKDQAKPKTKQQLRKEINILIAEDDDSGYYIMKSLLDDYTTSRAVDGREVLEKIREKDYDLVLMDIQMPEMDGLEATRKIREKDSTLPIIALTAKAMKGDRERCLEAGCSDYLSKPIEPEELIAKVSQYLPKKARQKEK